MNTDSDLAFRRLSTKERVPLRSRESHAPFAAARRARVTRPLTVGIHSSSLANLSEGHAALLGELETPTAHDALELLVLEGAPVPPLLEGATRFALRSSGGNHEAVIKRDRSETRAGVGWGNVLEYVAERYGLIMQDLLEIDAFTTLGADLVVVTDPRMLAARDDKLVVPHNLVTPEEALVIVGVWSRAIHAAFIPGVRVNNGLYYWALARALTPAGWPAFCGWVYGERNLPDGREMFELAGSILEHLKTMTQCLDRIFFLWQCGTDNDTMDETLVQFATLVSTAWSIHDNLALLVGRYLAIDLKPKHSPQWELGNKKWRKALADRAQTDQRAQGILDLLATADHEIAAVQQLRNDFLHRALNRMRRVSNDGGIAEGRIHVAGDTFEIMERDLGATPLGLDGWGIDHVMPAGRYPVTDISTNETWETDEPRSADLDPLVFGARLTDHVSRLVDGVFEVLDPASDERIGHRDRCRDKEMEDWASPPSARSVIASSPLASRVDWNAAL